MGDLGRDDKGRFQPGNPYGWQPGQSGQSVGRRDSLLDHLRRLGQEQMEDGRTRNQALAQALWDLALGKGSLRIRLAATEQILDRLHGRPSQSVKLGLGVEQPTELELRRRYRRDWWTVG